MGANRAEGESMKRVAKLVRQAAEERLRKRPVRVPVESVREGDLVAFRDLFGAERIGHVYHVQPRARRLVVGSATRADLPRGWKDLAAYHTWRAVIVEAQVLRIERANRRQPDDAHKAETAEPSPVDALAVAGSIQQATP